MRGHKKLGFTVIYIFTLFILPATGIAQDHEHEEGEVHAEHEEAHHHHLNEVGIAVSPVYFVKEETINAGLHLHYVHSLSSTKFGIGLGYERIFDEHEHSTIGLVVTYRLIESLSINLSPGVTLEKNKNAGFGMHLETSYEFALNDIHIGPALELAYDPEDFHISLGVHIGYSF